MCWCSSCCIRGHHASVDEESVGRTWVVGPFCRCQCDACHFICVISVTFILWVVLACFIGALIGRIIVFSISATKKGTMSPFRIVLAGAAVSAFLYAV